MNRLISIIVPVYNAETTLHRCVSALVDQTYKNIEIILVNDGSKDGSLAICQEFAVRDSRIRVIDKPNGGVSSARNAGLDIANGEFVMFCDSDDWAEPEWCYELISNYKDDCLIMCGHYVEGKQNYIPPEIKADSGPIHYDRKEFYKLKLCNFNAPWNKIYAMSVIRDSELRFNEQLTNGEDLLFILQYLNQISEDIVFLDKCVFHYNWPSEFSLSNKVSEDYFAQCCLLTNSILEQCGLLGALDARGKQQILTDRYNEFQKLIVSTIKDIKLSGNEAVCRLTKIMSSYEYQMCVSEANISPNKIYCWLARRKHGLGIWLWHKLRG